MKNKEGGRFREIDCKIGRKRVEVVGGAEVKGYEKT